MVSTGDDITFADSSKAIFGAGSDLQIYHSGAASFISDVGTGNLFIEADNIRIRDTSENLYIFGNSGGEVNLYYAGSEKLATTATGIDVTGTVTADVLAVDGGATINGVITSATTAPRFRLSETDTTDLNSELQVSGGNFQIRTGNDAFDTFEKRFQISNATGDISFFEDTGTTAKFFWDASAESLGIGTTSFPNAQNKLTIQGNAGASGSAANTSADEFFIDNNGDTGMTLGVVSHRHCIPCLCRPRCSSPWWFVLRPLYRRYGFSCCLSGQNDPRQQR